jgi:ABC-type sugar transport system permease subunit
MKQAKRIPFKTNLVSYLFLSPFLLIFGTFLLFPIFYSFWLSFSVKAPGFNLDMNFVGLDNYIRLFKDVEFGWSLLMTLYYAVLSIPMGISVSLLLAILLNNKLKCTNFLRSGFFLPNVLDMLVIGIIWTLLYSTGGPINNFLSIFGIKMNSSLLGNAYTAMISVVFALVLKGAGYGMILFLSTLQNIPKDLYEAGDIDGATKWEQFKYITWPLIQPMILFMVITGVISSLNAFTEIFAMTKGGPFISLGGNTLGATKLSGFYLYEKWEMVEYGYAAAISYIILLITMVISWINMKVFKERD